MLKTLVKKCRSNAKRSLDGEMQWHTLCKKMQKEEKRGEENGRLNGKSSKTNQERERINCGMEGKVIYHSMNIEKCEDANKIP